MTRMIYYYVDFIMELKERYYNGGMKDSRTVKKLVNCCGRKWSRTNGWINWIAIWEVYALETRV